MNSLNIADKGRVWDFNADGKVVMLTPAPTPTASAPASDDWQPPPHLDADDPQRVQLAGPVGVVIPGRAPNPLNVRETRKEKICRATRQRRQTFESFDALLQQAPRLDVIAVLHVVSVGEYDENGLHAATKTYQDGVADWLRCNDKHARVRWLLTQSRGTPSVEIEVRPVTWVVSRCDPRSMALCGDIRVVSLGTRPDVRLVASCGGFEAASGTHPRVSHELIALDLISDVVRKQLRMEAYSE